MTRAELEAFAASAENDYQTLASAGYKINMARGKPCKDQLDLSNEILSHPAAGETLTDEGDVRNYGVLTGLYECRKLMGDLLGVNADNVIIGGCSSLKLMYDYIAQCYTLGAGDRPWILQGKVKFIAVVPGYDRHFGICQSLGIELVSVKIDSNGPDMDAVEELIKDPMVKGMLCVPKYSNPDGITYSHETVDRLARIRPAASDFRVIWDNAYCVHDLYDEGDELTEIMSRAAAYGNEDLFVEFASTSKMTFPGSGVSAIVASDKNIAMIKNRLQYAIISYDKVNQLRHVRFFKDADGIKRHMKEHAAILRPKFDAVLDTLDDELASLGVAHWVKPKGGYFISLYVDVGSASRVGELCAAAGLTLTKVGATYPYGIDPDDANIRIAPSYPSVEELRIATRILCAAVRLCACEELLG